MINLFKKYDKDGNNYIEQSEVQPLLNDLGKELANKKTYTNDQINAILGTVDSNQDGRLTLDEVYSLMRKLNPN